MLTTEKETETLLVKFSKLEKILTQDMKMRKKTLKSCTYLCICREIQN